LDDRGMLLSSLRVRPNDDRIALGTSTLLSPETALALLQGIDGIK
jgi:hypothetical protein